MQQTLATPKKSSYHYKTITGIILVGLGLVILLNHTSFVLFPAWLFSWPVFLIIIGVGMGTRHNFKNQGWIILTMLGIIFLLPNIIPALGMGMLWPLLLIAIGINIIIRRHQQWNGERWERRACKEHIFNNNTDQIS